MKGGEGKRAVLLIEGNEEDYLLINRMFAQFGGRFPLKRVKTFDSAFAFLEREKVEIILSQSAQLNGLNADPLIELAKRFPKLPLIVLTEVEDDTLAHHLLRHGIQEFLSKRELTPHLLKRVLQHALERKRLESRLNEVNQLKSDFLSHVSHELRSPLTSMKECVSVVLSEEVGGLNGEQKRFLRLLEKGVERLHLILNDLLDMSKIEAGKFTLEIAPTDLVALVNEVVELFEKQFVGKGIALLAHSSSKEVVINGDHNRLMQVLMNLVNNAYKFTDQGQVAIEIVERGDHVACSVSDTGRGIASEDLPHVFRSFEQFGARKQGKELGSGLGLTISKQLIELHGGEMCVYSEENKGTTFTFTLPL